MVTVPRLALATLTLLAICGTALAEPVLRVYDVRDLSAVLPARATGGTVTIVPVLRDVPLQNSDGGTLRLETRYEGGPNANLSSTELVIARLCQQLKLEPEQLMEGVYVVTGEEAQHEQLMKLLEDVRSLYQGGYEFELFAYPGATAQAPALGTPADPKLAALCTRQVIARRVESQVNVTEELTYVRDWVPVVGNESVGYDPDPGTVTKGLRLTVTAGGAEKAAGQDRASAAPRGSGEQSGAGGTASLRVRGELIDAQIEKLASPLAPDSGGMLELGLPRTSTRTIQSDLRVTLGQPCVLAVVPGTKPGEIIVIAGTLRELK